MTDHQMSYPVRRIGRPELPGRDGAAVTPEASAVELTIAAGIARVELNRPARKNAVDSATAELLTAALEELGRRQDCRAVVLHGRGGDLSSGADLREAPAAEPRPPGRRGERALMLRAIRDCPVPVVAVVDGWAVGLGLAIAGACSYAVAGDGSRFALPEAAMGFFPYAVAPYLTDRVAPHVVLEWALSGRRFDAAEALAAGLVTEVCPAGTALATAGRLAGRIASAPRAVVEQGTGWLRRYQRYDGTGESFLDWCEERMAVTNEARRTRPATTPAGREEE